MKPLDKTVVYKHGGKHSEQEEIDNMYPFQLCPECVSQNTRILINIDDENGYNETGSYYYERSGLCLRKIIKVYHICNDCDCKWVHEIEDRTSRRTSEIDSNVAALIIVALLFAFSIISTICSWMVTLDYEIIGSELPALLCLWVVLSTIVTILLFCALLGCLGDGL